MARGRQRRESTELGEPEILPMMNVLFMLVMVLMGMSAFMPLGVISTEAPKLGGGGPGGAPAKAELGLTIIMLKDEMKIQAAGHIVAVLPSHDFKGLTDKLIEIKAQHPDETRVTLAPDANVKFNEIVQAMDASRQSPDGKILFPGVAFGAGVVE